jgi:hypothetical protein
MTAAETFVLVLGSILVVVGLAVIVTKEVTSDPWRSIEPRIRQLAEVLAPVLGAVLLLAALWAGVG